MRAMHITLTPGADDDTAAAILAAIACMLDQEEAGDTVEVAAPRSLWKEAAVLAAQGLPPTRRPERMTWATAERARREACWSYGIAGM
jgi:hypothetical protein